VSGVASQASILASHHHGPSSHRHAAAESRQPSTPFAALIDSDTQPPSPDRSERPQPGATASTGDGQSDKSATRAQNNQGADNATAADRSNTSDDTQSPIPDGQADDTAATDAADADAKAAQAKASEAKASEAAAATDAGDDKTAKADDDTAAVATDAAALPQPIVPEQPAAAPVAVVPTAGESAPDAKAAADLNDAATAPVGAPGSADQSAGETAAADAGAADAAKPNAGEIKGQAGRKGASASNGATGGKSADPKQAKSTDSDDSAAPAAAASDAAGEHKVAANATPADKDEAAHLHPNHQTGEPAAAKVETAPAAQLDAQAAADKPTADASQVAPQQQHPVERTLAPAAAAQPASTANNQVTVPVAGLAVEIAARAQAGSNRFEIRLDPPELGRIDVRLDVDRDGNVNSRLTVEKSETLHLLQRDAPQLERALQQAGLKTGDGGLQFSLRDQSFAGQNQNPGDQRPGAARIVVPDPDLPPVETVQGGYGRLLRPSGGIDIRV
jgi:flagellar hook-length control protein FliK